MRDLAARATRVLLPCALAAVVFAMAADAARAQFGIAAFSTSTSSSQAGAHPDLTTSFVLKADSLGNPIGQVANVAVALPPGAIGDPAAIERCSDVRFHQLKCGLPEEVGVLRASFVICQGVSASLEAPAEAGDETIAISSTAGFCASQQENTITIGSGASAETAKIAYVIDSTTLILEAPLEHAHTGGETVSHVATPVTVPLPLFNLQPTPGHVATFGASLLLASIFVQVDLNAEGRLTATISGISTLLTLQASSLTLWGVPADASHDSLRCNELGYGCGPAGVAQAPLVTYPTDCSGPPLQSDLTASSWQGASATDVATLPAPTDCEKLVIAPSMLVAPDTARRDTTAGYEVDLKVPQDEEPSELATPPLRDVSVTLPRGTSLSPGLANGLQTCAEAQFSRGACPNASKVGTAEIATPLLADHLTGAVYIGTPTAGEKYRLLVSVSADNATVRIDGQIHPDEETGQVSTVFRDLPQLPFSDFRLTLFGGPSAALANSPVCGTMTSVAQLASYAGQSANLSSTFTVNDEGETEICPTTQPFAPSFSAGTTAPLAGGFSPFTLTISRADGEQNLSAFTAQLPPGLVGLLKGVPLCVEPQAASGDCGQHSEVGTATIAAGAGSMPLYVSGPVYLTGPYGGAPFGLAVVVHAIAGPFDLGTVVVRSRIFVNPRDLALTIVSDPFPRILGGIPLRLRTVNVTLNRAGFVVNPTSCAPLVVNALITGEQGASAAVSTPFRVVDCADLRFAPRLAASTHASASVRGNGAGLEMTIVSKMGATATIHSVAVELPRQLRPRLTTIQNACLMTSALASVSKCPPKSLVGHATVSTPVTAAPLTGSIYLVVHPGTALPSLLIALEGEGVAADLEGTLRVSRRGTISTTFGSLPDVPISSFAVALPSGPHSMLGAVEDLCAKPLVLPYDLADQSGATVKGSARVAVSACPRKATRRRRARTSGLAR